MSFYITYNGAVRRHYYGKTKDRPFNTEKYGFINWFANKYDAHMMRDIIEENHPRAFLCLKRYQNQARTSSERLSNTN